MDNFLEMARLRVCDENSLKLLESLQDDLKNLSIETKKKFPQIKEACEEGIVKLRNAAQNPQTPVYHVTNHILYPVVQGCETKEQKVVKLCLGMIQKMITYQAVDYKGARFITDALWMLMESGIEEVKLLQSATLLLTTNSIVRGDALAKNLVLCFRLHFTKDSTIVNTAGATVRQLVSLVFERVVTEDEQIGVSSNGNVDGCSNLEQLKIPSNIPPKTLGPCAADAFLMFQDLVQLVNSDQPYWLNGLTEMTRTFGLELLESVLVNFPSVFFKHLEFCFLLKERVCALVIKLFSPNIKFRNYGQPSSIHHTTSFDKPYFPISIRLLRVVSTLVQKYHQLLVTECEIFLSLIMKFVDPDKPSWQRAVALEVLHKLSVQPELLMSFCECYDLKTHTTNIFQDIINCLATFVQSSFLTSQFVPSTISGSQNHSSSSTQTGPNISPQPGFFTRGVWLPVVVSFPSGQTKSTYLDLMDKVEPPPVPDGYGMSIAFACFLDIVRSLSLIIDTPALKQSKNKPPPMEDKKMKLCCQLINSSWCGILSALIPLVDSSTDETLTESLLKALQIYASLAGKLDLTRPRDAFIIAICKSSLPPSYAATILSSYLPLLAEITGIDSFGQDNNMQYNLSGYTGCELDYKQQVVAVGTPMPSATQQGVQGPVMLTAKNLQCMRALLILSHCHGAVLGSSWLLVLTTIQHLVWILGLKPSTGGSLKAGRTSTDSNAVITTAVMADLPVLSAMLSRLFESSQFLDDVPLHHLIDALCKLSHEAMELAYCNREPSLFAVAKLLETGLVNLSRVEVLWKPLTNHLLEVCQHPHIRMREWGVEAITYLVKSALQHKYEKNIQENQILLLTPLVELSTIPHGDVRQRQLECVLNILHSSGDLLTNGWPLILNIVGAISETHGENMIRLSFQCLQLVVTDFLPIMSWRCLPLCLETTAKFGSQLQELNISLTAIGSMWNIADYFYQNKDKLQGYLESDSSIFTDYSNEEDMPAFDKLWMCLFTKLSNLCVDIRPAVRKSAGQTLFSTISAHGALLSSATWQAVLWQVLFPLLTKVKNMSSCASNKKMDAGGNILIHHSRNTAQKQWAETQVLTLSGVSRVFNAKKQLLHELGNFLKAWSLLLEFVETAALSTNNEVSLAALRAFQEMLFAQDNLQGDDNDDSLTSDGATEGIWNVAWNVWIHIASESLYKPRIEFDSDYYPTQAFLTALIHIFPTVFEHIHMRFTSADLEKLCKILEAAAASPIFTDTTPFYLPASEISLSQLQDGILNCIDLLQTNALATKENMEKSICAVFHQLLSLGRYAYEKPNYAKKHMEQKFLLLQKDILVVNFVPFGEKAIAMVVNLYQQTAEQLPVVKGQILKSILEVLHAPLSRRYERATFNTWKLVVASFMTVLSYGIPLARKYKEDFESMWPQLALSLDHLLFPKNIPSPADRVDPVADKFFDDEEIDCQVIEFLKDEILSYSSFIPKEFILQIVILLNKGSIISSAHNSVIRRGNEVNLREEFAKICFETLLQFSLLDSLTSSESDSSAKTGDSEEELAGRLAVTALLYRFQEVLKKYVVDESRAGKCPLPRHRLSEISFVLKAITTLITSLKKHPEKVGKSVWEQVIKLYPHLVGCSISNSSQVADSLREVLHEYYDLLAPPDASIFARLSSENEF